jgi:DNA-binding PadR family transcriptional regulator
MAPVHTHLGEFEQVLLFALVRLGRAHGAVIREEIEERTGRSVSPGAIYTAMDRLEQRGLVASAVESGTKERGGRRRKEYWLRPAGARVLEESYERVQRMADGQASALRRLREANRRGAT